ncbi:MAG: argininosuccinate lyase [Flavobacteriales bacterium]|nr:argininosuccinate lyase [Flavobacteriales bacterium]
MGKIWKRDFDTDKAIEEFTVGKDRELDLSLAEFDIYGSLAHIQMLQSIDLLTADELSILQVELKNILVKVKAGEFVIEDGIEDVHSQIENDLTLKLGDVGKKIHSGRSRNDQVLVDLKLYIRAELQQVVENTKTVFSTLIGLSEEHKEKLIPGFTHLQIAMPSSYGLWFGAYAESLVDDLEMMLAAFKIANQNPLGSAAGYGSSFPLDRMMTTQLLGFEGLNYNVVYAQMGRGKTEKSVASALSFVAGTLGKMSMDICLYMNQNFGLISFPKELTTGSSIMPHKRNPDVFELIRAKCNKLNALPNEINMITGNLPSGYHRDLQLIKESFMPAFDQLNGCLAIANHALKNIIVNDNALADDKYTNLFTVEEVNKKVLEGIPFRDAYKEIGGQVDNGTFTADKKVDHTHQGSIGNLCNAQISARMDALVEQFGFGKIEAAIEELVK